MLVTDASDPATCAVRLPQKFSAATTRTPLVAAGPVEQAPSKTVVATAIPNPAPMRAELRMILISASYGLLARQVKNGNHAHFSPVCCGDAGGPHRHGRPRGGRGPA